jgi:HSP20 family protein
MLFDPIDPRFFSPLQALHSMQEEFERLFHEPGVQPAPIAFALYRRENGTSEDGLLLRTTLPGVEAKDIALDIDGQAVSLSGAWPLEPESESALAKHIERPRGRFTRTLRAPFEIDAARVQARFERGVLEVELPRLQKNAPVKIHVLPEAKRN